MRGRRDLSLGLILAQLSGPFARAFASRARLECVCLCVYARARLASLHLAHLATQARAPVPTARERNAIPGAPADDLSSADVTLIQLGRAGATLRRIMGAHNAPSCAPSCAPAMLRLARFGDVVTRRSYCARL